MFDAGKDELITELRRDKARLEAEVDRLLKQLLVLTDARAAAMVYREEPPKRPPAEPRSPSTPAALRAVEFMPEARPWTREEEARVQAAFQASERAEA